jgi:hypothetical protein
MRNQGTGLICVVMALSALLPSGCSDTGTSPGDFDSVTVIFRDGAEPLPSWYGTRDAVIRNGPSPAMQQTNMGTAPVDTLGAVDIGGTLFSRRLLVRFDLTSITDCAEVIEGRLTLHLEPEDTNLTFQLEAWEATVPAILPGSWAEGFQGEGVSWIYADEGVVAWDSPGGDRLGLMDTRTVGADTTVTFELDAERVERWIKVPSSNDGLLIAPVTRGREAFLHVYMRETAAALRPELSIRYIKGG